MLCTSDDISNVPKCSVTDKHITRDLNYLSNIYAKWILNHSMIGIWNELQLLFQLLYSTTIDNPSFLENSPFKDENIILNISEKSILAAKTLNHLNDFIYLMVDAETLNTIRLHNSIFNEHFTFLFDHYNDSDENDISKPLSRLSLPFNASEDSSKYFSHSHSAQLLYHNRQRIRDLFFDFIRKYVSTLDPQFNISTTEFIDKQSMLIKASQSIQELWAALHRENIKWFVDFFLSEYLLTFMHQTLYPSTNQDSSNHPKTDTVISSRKLNKLEARFSQPSSKQTYLLLKRKQGKELQKDLFLYFLDHIDSDLLNAHLISAIYGMLIKMMTLNHDHIKNQENDLRTFSKENIEPCKEQIVKCVQLGRMLSYLHTNILDYIEDRLACIRIDTMFYDLLPLIPDPFVSPFVFLMFLAFLSTYTRSLNQRSYISNSCKSLQSMANILLESHQRISDHIISNSISLHGRAKIWVVSVLWIEDILENLSIQRPFIKNSIEMNNEIHIFDAYFIDNTFMKIHFELFSQFQTFIQPLISQDKENVQRTNNPLISIPIRTVKPALVVHQNVTTNPDIEIQKSLRRWFHWRYPKLKECINSLVKVMPEFLSEEILYNSDRMKSKDTKSDSDEVYINQENEQIHNIYKDISLNEYRESTRKRIDVIFRSICPPHTSEQVIRVAGMLVMERLDPELEKRYRLVQPHNFLNIQM